MLVKQASRGATHERGTLDARREKQGCQDSRQPSDHQLRDDCRAIPVRRARKPTPARGFGQVARTISTGTLTVAFLLNIAIILFGWRRSKDLRDALEAYEAAERLAQTNANTDPNTGLANRRELMRALEDMLEAKGQGVLLLLDLDHFKRVNDLHGHLAGDQLLKTFADTIKRASPDGPAARGLEATNLPCS